jgi:hypothetical protein
MRTAEAGLKCMAEKFGCNALIGTTGETEQRERYLFQ